MELFGDLFDFNGDGELDTFEEAVDFGAFLNMIDSCQKDELQAAGLDVDALELMTDDERREAILNAGLDPDDFDLMV